MNEQERGEQQWGRAILALAVKKLGSDWHSGPWSKGYRKLCQADRILRSLEFLPGASDPHEWPEVRDTAAAYLWAHRRDVAREW